MRAAPGFDLAFSATRAVSFERVTRNRMHLHSFYEPCIVSGSGEFEHGPRVFALREGDLFIADPGVHHEIRSLGTKDLKLFFLAFHVVRSTHAGAGMRPAFPDFLAGHSVHLSDQTQLIPLFEHVARLSPQPEGFYRSASLLLLDQIIAALTDATRHDAKAHDERLHKSRVVDAIERLLHEPLRISALARECAMSERTLRRKWREWGERSLNEEINARRIERATHLLLMRDLSIAEVGNQVGIEDPAQFSRAFRTAKGLSPSVYRQRHLRAQSGVRVSIAPFRTEFLDGDSREYAS